MFTLPLSAPQDGKPRSKRVQSFRKILEEFNLAGCGPGNLNTCLPNRRRQAGIRNRSEDLSWTVRNRSENLSWTVWNRSKPFGRCGSSNLLLLNFNAHWHISFSTCNVSTCRKLKPEYQNIPHGFTPDFTSSHVTAYRIITLHFISYHITSSYQSYHISSCRPAEVRWGWRGSWWWGKEIERMRRMGLTRPKAPPRRRVRKTRPHGSQRRTGQLRGTLARVLVSSVDLSRVDDHWIKILARYHAQRKI